VDVDDLVRDALPVNGQYASFVAEAYDVWLPPSGNYSDREVYRRAIEAGSGTALELGCGNGRLLVPYLSSGLEVEGVDASQAMLDICAAHARDAGVRATLHHCDWSALALDRKYATIYNPAGSFALLPGDEAAHTALEVWRRHLNPGGTILIAMGVPSDDLDAHYDWRVRRSGTRASDGVTFMVHEAFRYDTSAQVQHVLNKHEMWSREGELMTTLMRRHEIRWWTREQLEEMLRDSGLADVRSLGTASEFVTLGRAPAT
jgi:SAM-dependent methyltransferase